MLAEIETIDLGDVTLTQSMIMMGVVIMLLVQLFRAVLGYVWPMAPAEIKKPLISLVAVGMALFTFYVTKMESWLMGGIVIGLASGGGYEFTKNMAGLVKKEPNKITEVKKAFVLLLCFILLTVGCVAPLSEPAQRNEFLYFNERVQDWAERCKADPNECKDGLLNMAKEMDVWAAIVAGVDPNGGE